jgi:hypothetical protein
MFVFPWTTDKKVMTGSTVSCFLHLPGVTLWI